MNQRTIAGRTLRWARKRAGLTQEELARAVGMPQPSIARIERGGVGARLETVAALLEATGHRLAVEPIGDAVDREPIRRRLALDPSQRTWEALGRPRATQRPHSPIRMLPVLRRHGVPYVVVGELAEVVQGAPISLGRDIHVCRADSDDARERLVRALDALEATPGDAGYATALGRLHVVTRTAAGDDYATLARTATSVQVDAGYRDRVASLEDLERARRAAGSAEDIRAAELLRATVEEAAAVSTRA